MIWVCYKRLREENYIWPLTFSFESREDKDEIVVEVGELVELFKFLSRQLRIISLWVSNLSDWPLISVLSDVFNNGTMVKDL